jgi:hypothetical protein
MRRWVGFFREVVLPIALASPAMLSAAVETVLRDELFEGEVG